jgi:hypothetical protein
MGKGAAAFSGITLVLRLTGQYTEHWTSTETLAFHFQNFIYCYMTVIVSEGVCMGPSTITSSTSLVYLYVCSLPNLLVGNLLWKNLMWKAISMED